MLRLYVMRHAKSSWAVPGARDFDRELNDRGWSDLVKISKILQRKNYNPEKILCSPSSRTRQTLDGIKDVLPENTEIAFTEGLYSSGMSEYLEIIQETKDCKSLMIIGHNPMCGSLAASLPSLDSDYPMDTISYKYPTATVAVIEFDCDTWSEIEKSKGNLIDCLIPSELS